MVQIRAVASVFFLLTACGGESGAEEEECPGGGVLRGDFCVWGPGAWCERTVVDRRRASPATRLTRRTFDEQGRVATEEEIDLDGAGVERPLLRSTFSWDGNVRTARQDLDLDGEPDSVLRVTYDNDGRVVQVEQDLDLDGVVDFRSVTERDVYGREVRLTLDASDDAGDQTVVTTWTGTPVDGVETSRRESDVDDVLRFERVRDEGWLTEHRSGTGEERWDYEVQYTLAARGIPVSSVEVRPEGSLERSWSYDEAGRLVQVATMRGGRAIEVRDFTYDDRGRRTSSVQRVEGEDLETTSWVHECEG